MAEKIVFESYKEMPLRAMTVGDMTWNLTGSWRNVRPVYDSKTSPCRLGCPAQENIQRYIFLVTEGRYQEAWRTVVENNPMPSITGRVCFHPCMERCTREDYDDAINIPGIERAIGDMGLDNPDWLEPVEATRKESIAVVGGGPAGLSCAFYLARHGFPVTIYERDDSLGGVLRWGIPSYRLPNDLLDRVVAQITGAGPVTVETGVDVGADVSMDELLSRHKAVFLGMGLMKSRGLGIDGEEMAGVEPGLSFLRRVNAGETVDAGKKAVVIGGGNTAMDVARCALRAGAEVTVVYRRTRNEMPAIAEEIDEAEREGIAFRFLAAPAEIVGSKKGLEKIVFQEMELGEPDDSGRRRPVPIEGKTFELAADRLFTAIGEQGDLSGVEDAVETEWNLVTTTGDGVETSNERVFAGGDVTTGAASVVEAVAAGRRAAGRIAHRIAGEPDFEPADERTVGIEDMNLAYFSHAKRVPLPRITADQARGGFDEIFTGFDADALAREADRCFSCGVCNFCDNCWMYCPDVAIVRNDEEEKYEIDLDFCKGCLVCVTECPRNALSIEEEGK